MQTADEAVDSALVDSLRAHDLIAAEESPRFFRIHGGVSANVWRVEVGERSFCVKQALEQLRVADTWHAPTSRCAAEAAWLRLAGTVGLNVPTVLAELPALNATVMSWIETDTHTNWKQQLLSGTVDPGFAAALGHDIGSMHRATAGDPAIAAQFENPDAFDALRLEPYFEYAIPKNPSVARELNQLVEQLRAARIALVHGDLTPKNILVGDRPVILDAEVATYGDPAFDAALCCAHLLLKSAAKPELVDRYLGAMSEFAGAWFEQADWEPLSHLQQRLGRIIGAILIARVDGKSPAEYLAEKPARHLVRAAGRQMVSGSGIPFTRVADVWRDVTSEGTPLR